MSISTETESVAILPYPPTASWNHYRNAPNEIIAEGMNDQKTIGPGTDHHNRILYPMPLELRSHSSEIRLAGDAILIKPQSRRVEDAFSGGIRALISNHV